MIARREFRTSGSSALQLSIDWGIGVLCSMKVTECADCTIAGLGESWALPSGASLLRGERSGSESELFGTVIFSIREYHGCDGHHSCWSSHVVDNIE
jgi:hypothetical protein